MKLKKIIPAIALITTSTLRLFADAQDPIQIKEPLDFDQNTRPIYVIPSKTAQTLKPQLAQLAKSNQIIWAMGDLVAESNNEQAQELAKINIFGLADLKATQMHTVIEACYILNSAHYLYENLIQNNAADEHFKELVELGKVFGPLKETLAYANAADTYINGMNSQKEHLSEDEKSTLLVLARLQQHLTNELEAIAISLNEKLRESTLIEQIKNTHTLSNHQQFNSLQEIIDEHIRRLALAQELFDEWKPQFDSINKNLFAPLSETPYINPTYSMDATCTHALKGLAELVSTHALTLNDISSTELRSFYASFKELGYISPLASTGHYEADELNRLEADLINCSEQDPCILPHAFASNALQAATIGVAIENLLRTTSENNLPIVITIPADLWINVHSWIANSIENIHTHDYADFLRNFPPEEDSE